jgi:hypothetical protein
MCISLSLDQQNRKLLNSHKSLTVLIAYQVFVLILVQTKAKEHIAGTDLKRILLIFAADRNFSPK